MRRARWNASLLWGAQLISATGDALFLPCVAWLAGRASGSQVPVGVVVALATGPYLAGPFLGPLVDRVDRRALMVASDLLRAVTLLAFVGLALTWGGAGVTPLYALALVLGLLSVPFQPARDALLPDLVEGGSLPRWNAAMQISSQVAQVLGLFLGAWLLSGGGDRAGEERRVLALLAWDGASFLLSALALAWMRLPSAARGPRAVSAGYWKTARVGWGLALRDPVVRGLLALTALDNLAIMGPAIVGATLFVQRELGLPAAALARFDGAMAVGMLLGSLAYLRLARRLPLAPTLLLAMGLDGLTYLPFYLLPTFDVALAAILLHGAAIPFLVVPRTSLLHLHVPAERRGQVFALVGVTVAGMTAVSAALSGAVAAALGPRALFLSAGVLGTLCGVLGWVWLGRRLSAAEAAAAGRGLERSQRA